MTGRGCWTPSYDRRTTGCTLAGFIAVTAMTALRFSARRKLVAETRIRLLNACDEVPAARIAALDSSVQTAQQADHAVRQTRRVVLDATVHVLGAAVVIIGLDRASIVIVTAALPTRVRVARQVFARMLRCGFGLLLASRRVSLAARSAAPSGSQARVVFHFASLQARRQRFVR
jgi:hypothetical protein